MKNSTRMVLAVISFVLFFGLRLGSLFANDDFQYWSRYSLKLIDTKYVDYFNNWDLRFYDDASDLGFWYSTQKLQAAVHKNLNLGVAYTYLESEVVNPKTRDFEFKYQHRLELEINPQWKLGEHFKLLNRNRTEFRWIEDRGSDHARFRHLWEIGYSIKKWRVDEVYMNNEVFVDFNTHRINENWVTPFGLSFKICPKASLKVFYLIQSKKTGLDWASNQVLGTQLSVSV